MSCFRQTCDQTITGRSFSYGRALEVVQTEDYLEDIDFDFIRRRSDFHSDLTRTDSESRQKRQTFNSSEILTNEMNCKSPRILMSMK